MGFRPAKTFLSAVELGVFTALGNKALTTRQLQQELGLHPRGVTDFLDTLVALDVLSFPSRRVEYPLMEGGDFPALLQARSLERDNPHRR